MGRELSRLLDDMDPPVFYWGTGVPLGQSVSARGLLSTVVAVMLVIHVVAIMHGGGWECRVCCGPSRLAVLGAGGGAVAHRLQGRSVCSSSAAGG